MELAGRARQHEAVDARRDEEARERRGGGEVDVLVVVVEREQRDVHPRRRHRHAAQDTVEPVSASAVAAPGLRRSLRPLGLLTSGHLVTDLAQGSVPALLPFLRNELHLSYTRTAAIMLAATVASSVVQPVFGHLFDTRRGEWLLVAGPALAGLGIGALAFAHSFATALLCVLASSIGVAAFHPGGEQVRRLAVGRAALDGDVGVLGRRQPRRRPRPAARRPDRVAVRPRRRLAARDPGARRSRACSSPAWRRSAARRRTRASPPRAPGATAGARRACCSSRSPCAATCTSACSRSSRCSSTTRATTAAPTARACSR